MGPLDVGHSGTQLSSALGGNKLGGDPSTLPELQREPEDSDQEAAVAAVRKVADGVTEIFYTSRTSQ